MSSFSIARACVALAGAAAVLASHAEEAGLAQRRAWIAAVAAQTDDASSEAFLASFDLSLGEDTWLSLGAGRSRSAESAGDVVADSLRVGVDHRFGKIGISFDAERWGDAGAFESTDFGAAVYVQSERLRVGLGRERRAIDIEFGVLGALDRTLTRTAGVDADGTRFDLRLQVARRWQVHASATEYDYSRNVAALPRIEQLNLLSASALTLAHSMVEKRAAVGFEWEAGNQLLSLVYGRDRSAVDASRFTTLDGAILFPAARRIDLEISLGKSRSELVGSGMHGGVLVLIYGR